MPHPVFGSGRLSAGVCQRSDFNMEINGKRALVTGGAVRIGRAIGDQLSQRLGRTEVAEIMGISPEMVRRIENRALYKVQARLVQLRQELLNS